MRGLALLILMVTAAAASAVHLTAAPSPARRLPRAAAAANPLIKQALFKGTAKTTAAEPGAASDGGRQREYGVGASVYDRSQAASKRGYGTISEAGDPGRWRVAWQEAGLRSCVISEPYLELALVHHSQRVVPTAMKQAVVVVLGTHKGKAGTTIKRVGIKWQCQLDGLKGVHTFDDDHLHATGAAPAGGAVAPFKPVCLAPGLPLAGVPEWMLKYKNDPATAIDPVLVKPSSHAWADVLTCQASIADLSDSDALALKYIAAPYMGKAAVGSGAATTAAADPAVGSSAAEPDVSVRAGLQRAAGGKWTMCHACPFAGQGCPWQVEVRHAAGSSTADVWQTGSHQFHAPTSAAERGKLTMHPTIQAWGARLLQGGVKPAMAANVVSSMALEAGDPLGLGITDGCLGPEHFSNGRISITKQQMTALKKKVDRASGYGASSDPLALAAYVAELETHGCVGWYQPFKAACGTGQPGQPLIVVTQTPIQKRLLDEFGQRMVFLDSTFGVNRYGYPLTALLVQDEAGCYLPVGFMVSSSEEEEVYEGFLRTLLRGAREVGDGSFKYDVVMIDKSKTEIAAVNALVAAGLAGKWLLCYFHFLQDWERFLVSKESGVSSRAERQLVMVMLASLAHTKDRTKFAEELGAFCVVMHQRGWRPVADRMQKPGWKGLAEHWAWWGRLHVLDLCANTNNGAERFFGLLKYTDLQRNAQMSVFQLMQALHRITLARYIQNRAHRLAGRTTSDQQQQEERAQRAVNAIVESGRVVLAPTGAPGLAWVYSEDGEVSATVCLGDLSCTCGYSSDRPCIHMRAAAKHAGFTHALRRQAAEHLVTCNQLVVDVQEGLCTAVMLADITKPVYCRPREGVCTCHDHALHGICCHLMAAAMLPGEQCMEMQLAVELAAPAAEQETQRIEIKGRAFQQPRREPLGDDWAAELRQLQGARQATADAIHRTARSDPTGLRAKVAECGRMLASLPEGEAEQARQEVESLHAKLALVADGVALRPTKQRSGKQQRRRGQRDDSDKLTRPLQPGRRSQAGKRKLQAALTTDVVSDTLPRLRQKLEDSKKFRNVTKPGNEQGTTLRNGSTHHRVPQQKKTKA